MALFTPTSEWCTSYGVQQEYVVGESLDMTLATFSMKYTYALSLSFLISPSQFVVTKRYARYKYISSNSIMEDRRDLH